MLTMPLTMPPSTSAASTPSKAGTPSPCRLGLRMPSDRLRWTIGRLRSDRRGFRASIVAARLMTPFAAKGDERQRKRGPSERERASYRECVPVTDGRLQALGRSEILRIFFADFFGTAHAVSFRANLSPHHSPLTSISDDRTERRRLAPRSRCAALYQGRNRRRRIRFRRGRIDEPRRTQPLRARRRADHRLDRRPLGGLARAL